MWMNEDIMDIFRTSAAYYFVIALPIFIIISPTMPVDAVTEFSVFRLQQYELHGYSHGSQSSLVNVEARTLDSSSLARRCILAKLADLTAREYHRVVSEGAAALLVLVPTNLTTISHDEKALIWDLESTMIRKEVQMAVYFTSESEEILGIYESVRTAANTDAASSAAAALLGSLSSDGYQLVVGGSQSKQISDMTIANIQGKLSGYGVEEQLPTIAIVAHYDTLSVAPELSEGIDSNGSGVMVLLELARIFSKLYSSTRAHPRVNIVFLLSGGGSINYQGSRRFLEDQMDSSDSPLLMEAHFVLCLDTLANEHGLNLHVSKVPKDTSHGNRFYQILERVGPKYGVPISMVHKRINLQDSRQDWEHEKFSMNRLPAFTLSRLPNPKTGERGSILDNLDNFNLSDLTRHTKVIASSLLQHIYNISTDDLLSEGLDVSEESMKSWLNLISSQARSPQLLHGKNNPLVNTLHQMLNRYTNEAKVTWVKADRHDPEWTFYDVTKAPMTAYAVKPASFDFFLTMFIVAYLAVIYVFLQYFPNMFVIFTNFACQQKVKTQ